MDFLQEFNRIMESSNEIALATSTNNIPNVRIVNFYHDIGEKGILYFSTFRDNPKTKEFVQNNTVSFTTVPLRENEHIRVYNAKVSKSKLTIYDLKDGFIKKIPGYEEIITHAAAMLDLYEIHFKEANVIIDVTKRGKVTF